MTDLSTSNLRVTTFFYPDTKEKRNTFYVEAVKECLLKVLPEVFFEPVPDDPILHEQRRHELLSLLPLVKTSPCDEKPENIAFFLLGKLRSDAFKFFFDMISKWLVPGKRLNVAMLYSFDFLLPDYSKDVYTLTEVLITVDDTADLVEIQCNLPIIEMEIRLGIESAYYARRILEVKGLSADEKTAMLQECAVYLIRRFPKVFDRDLFIEMQHVFVMCSDEFKELREAYHLSRIITTHYYFRKQLLHSIKQAADKRYFFLRLYNSKIICEDGSKRPVLSVLVGLNFLADKEVFEEQHLLAAIFNHIPNVKVVRNSFFSNRRGKEHIATLYLEVEKEDDSSFSRSEVLLLRECLPADLKDRISHLLHPVFMPRNEEEIMRNVLTLSNQIKFTRDIPQVLINFDEQSQLDLYFTVIIVRVVMPGSPSVQELFNRSGSFLEYFQDRCKMVGMLRKKYTKEVTVFRVKIGKREFLRQDHSIDLYKARHQIVKELFRIIGEFRDYNGGMISKQNELLSLIKKLLADRSIKYSDITLENFFFSLMPVIMRTVLDPEDLVKLFLMLLDSIEKGPTEERITLMNVVKEGRSVFIMIAAKDEVVREDLYKAIGKLPRQSAALASSLVNVHNMHYIGYLYRCDNLHAQDLFCATVEEVLKDSSLPHAPSIT